jgi:hypothetical protein
MAGTRLRFSSDSRRLAHRPDGESTQGSGGTVLTTAGVDSCPTDLDLGLRVFFYF